MSSSQLPDLNMVACRHLANEVKIQQKIFIFEITEAYS